MLLYIIKMKQTLLLFLEYNLLLGDLLIKKLFL